MAEVVEMNRNKSFLFPYWFQYVVLAKGRVHCLCGGGNHVVLISPDN